MFFHCIDRYIRHWLIEPKMEHLSEILVCAFLSQKHFWGQSLTSSWAMTFVS